MPPIKSIDQKIANLNKAIGMRTWALASLSFSLLSLSTVFVASTSLQSQPKWTSFMSCIVVLIALMGASAVVNATKLISAIMGRALLNHDRNRTNELA